MHSRPTTHPHAQYERTETGAGRIDYRLSYVFFAITLILGYGLTAVTFLGTTSELVGWLSVIILAVALIAGIVTDVIASRRADRSLTAPERRSAGMLKVAWITAFVGLGLSITGVTWTLQVAEDWGLQTLLWLAGSALVVGVMYIAEGIFRRDRLHYWLGTALVLITGIALLFPPFETLLIIAIGGGATYLAALILAQRSVHARLTD